ncbi:glycosyltransferase WbuB [Cryobacterium suzukii]|uniref:Glycosyltransferase WbuB n=1 Tax=Cryobacterium suzukii TaxID=1259198 RepID=A0A4R9AJE7_9MICO|nr:glycosyltransferase family 4 protein [Cryobacterium suzukii]TFD63134.1 glycosyltransferase WbuB [Cryobacterium suzukii]
MRALVVAGQFAGPGISPWLLDDLVLALAQAGHEVDVIVFDSKHARPKGPAAIQYANVRICSVGPTVIRPGRIGKLLAHSAAGFGLHTRGYRFSHGRDYDVCMYTSIATFSWGFPTRLRIRGRAKTLLFILWDFFPIHQIEIGRIRARAWHMPLRHLERASMKRADIVAVMSDANERFLRSYHPGLKAQIAIVPPWASGPNVFASGTRRDRFTAVFGGQLAHGRGIETLLLAAKELQGESNDIEILVLGDGTEKEKLIATSRDLGLNNLVFQPSLPRSEYRALINSVHVGIAITVPNVTPPTFPSKIVEYCASALPVVVCVEESSDAGQLIEQWGAGIAVPAGDSVALARALLVLYAEYKAGSLPARSDAALALFSSELSVSRAVSRLEAAVELAINTPGRS